MAEAGKGRSRKRSQSKAEIDAHVAISRIHMRGQVLVQAVRWIGLAACVGLFSYFGIFRTIEILAGETTIANIDIGFLLKVIFAGGAAAVFGGGGVLYGLRQARLRRDTIESVGKQKAFLEKQFDPNRSSSGLTPRGGTRPEDRP